jgi:GDP-L-fucose synthase
MNKNSKIYLTGHTGLVGSAILRRLKALGFKRIIVRTSSQLDLRNQTKVNKFLKKNKPDYVINAAAKVGGIQANNIYRGEFIYDNLAIQTNIIHSCYINNIKNMIFLGSSCVYPRNCKQPIKEEYLLNGKLEYTNEPYAIAKIAGIKMCESYNYQYNTNYKCLMPCNTYGPNDNYDLHSSHFFPALIRKIHFAGINKDKIIKIWGTGQSMRELMYVDDVAEACIFFLDKKTKESLINIGSSIEKKIEDYAKFICKQLNVKIKIIYDKKKPDGTPRKILNNSIAKKYGWKAKVSLKRGLEETYKEFLKKINYLRL